jgi:PKD repeat protein
MAVGDRLAFYLCNVTFTPSGGNETVFKASSITLTEDVATVDVTTLEDNGYANQLATLSTISGSINVFKREGEDLQVKARQKGLLKWYDLKSNITAGNQSLNVQITTITRGEANVQGAIPCSIAFVGQGGWANGSWGA